MMIEIPDNISRHVSLMMHGQAHEVLSRAAEADQLSFILPNTSEDGAYHLAGYRAMWVEYRYLASQLFPESNTESRDQIEASWENYLAAAIASKQEEWERKEKCQREINPFLHNWSDDERPFADALRAWAELHGVKWGVNRWLSEQLLTPERTVSGWLQGKQPPCEPLIRRAMETFDQAEALRIQRRLRITV